MSGHITTDISERERENSNVCYPVLVIGTHLPGFLEQFQSLYLSGQHGQSLPEALLQAHGIQDLHSTQVKTVHSSSKEGITIPF